MAGLLRKTAKTPNPADTDSIQMDNGDYASGIPVSIVVPLLNEQDSLGELTAQIVEAMDAIPDQTLRTWLLKEGALDTDRKASALPNLLHRFELIFVDDGSTDQSWTRIVSLVADNRASGGRKSGPLMRGIRLQRNYGKSAALQAGFDQARGAVVVTMDADLQDDPHEIREMVELLRQGYDVVSGWKKKRYDPITKTLPSLLFNRVTRTVTGIPLHDFNCGLKVYRREVIESVFLYGEMHRYVPLLAKQEGFGRITEKVVQHRPRKYGKTKFGLSRFLNGFLDLMTLKFMHTYTRRPMHFFGAWGVLLLLAGVAINLYLAYIKIVLGVGLSNRPLLFLGILLLLVGAQFFSIGLLGEMINSGNAKGNRPGIRETA